MRPGQNPKRARRGRGKPFNFSNRTFDSNGPDVKIRGTAAHIYEKYQVLARDAHAAGDRVSAENYLQHAEHYYRILSAFNAQNANGAFNNGGRQQQANNGEGPQPNLAQKPPAAAFEEEAGDDAEAGEDTEAISS